jgi:hypothetical protein
MAPRKIRVVGPEGETGTVPADMWPDAQAAGYTLAEGEVEPGGFMYETFAHPFVEDPARGSAAVAGTLGALSPAFGGTAAGLSPTAMAPLAEIGEYSKEEAIGNLLLGPAFAGAGGTLRGLGSGAGKGLTLLSSKFSGAPFQSARRLYERPGEMFGRVSGIPQGLKILSGKSPDLFERKDIALNKAGQMAEKMTGMFKQYRKDAINELKKGTASIKTPMNAPMTLQTQKGMWGVVQSDIAPHFALNKNGVWVPKETSPLPDSTLKAMQPYVQKILGGKGGAGAYSKRSDLIKLKQKMDSELQWSAMDNPFKADQASASTFKNLRNNLRGALEQDIPGLADVNKTFHEKMNVFEKAGGYFGDTDKNKKELLRIATGPDVGPEDPMWQAVRQVGGEETLDDLASLAYIGSDIGEGSRLGTMRNIRNLASLGSGLGMGITNWADPFMPRSVLAASIGFDPFFQREMLPALGATAKGLDIPMEAALETSLGRAAAGRLGTSMEPTGQIIGDEMPQRLGVSLLPQVASEEEELRRRMETVPFGGGL